jgi:hypothetical protein
MTQGQINALFAAGKLSPEEAADQTLGIRDERAKEAKQKAYGNPFVFLCLIVFAFVAAVFGAKRPNALN